MNFQIGQQIFGGQIIVLYVTPTYVTLAFPQLGDERGPYTITVTPSTTVGALNNLLEALLAVVPTSTV